eukprot:4847111-Prymnesium_polylepis.1
MRPLTIPRRCSPQAESNAELVKQPLAAAVAKMRAKSPTGDDEVMGRPRAALGGRGGARVGKSGGPPFSRRCAAADTSQHAPLAHTHARARAHTHAVTVRALD